MHTVSVRGGFSDRNNIAPIGKEIQLKTFDKRTRVQLLNTLSEMFVDVYGEGALYDKSCAQDFYRFVMGKVYSEKIDFRREYSYDEVFRDIGETIEEADYDQILTLIEKVVEYWDDLLKNAAGLSYYNSYSESYESISLFEIMNECFEREFIGYRFIEGLISPISDENEVVAIEEALNTGHVQIREHFAKANRYLSDREKPDYANSIKESISSVEAICKIILKDNSKEATLGKMLNKLKEEGIEIHESLMVAFKKLYEYASDAKGIRHAGNLDGPSASFEEAKFMLVSCAAFVNYLSALHAD